MPNTPPYHRARSIDDRAIVASGERSEDRSVDTAVNSHADQIILDIEDAVDPKRKQSAPIDVATWLQNNSAWVRINDRSTRSGLTTSTISRGRPDWSV